MLERIKDTFLQLPYIFRGIYAGSEVATLRFWTVPFFSLLAFYFLWLSAYALLGIGKSEEETPGKESKTTALCRSIQGIVIAAVILASGLCIWIAILSQQEMSARRSLEIPSLLALALALAAGWYGLWQLKQRFYLRRLKDLVLQPTTPAECTKAEMVVRRLYKRLRMLMLVPLLGLGVLLVPMTQPTFLSLVLDNSSSMNEALEVARRVLGSTLQKMPAGSLVEISTVDGNGKKPTVKAIRETLDPDQLAGEITRCETVDKAVAYLGRLETQGSSPIAEVIWKTYLNSQGRGRGLRKELVVISDGQDPVEFKVNGIIQTFPGVEEFHLAFPRRSSHFLNFYSASETPQRSALFDAVEQDGYRVEDVSASGKLESRLLAIVGALTIEAGLIMAAVLLVILSFIGLLLWGMPKHINLDS